MAEIRTNRLTKLTFEEMNELCCEIIESFEDFLDRRGIVLENEEKEEDECASNIYGYDYAELEDEVRYALKKWGLVF